MSCAGQINAGPMRRVVRSAMDAGWHLWLSCGHIEERPPWRYSRAPIRAACASCPRGPDPIIGQRFGALVVTRQGKRTWHFHVRCDCGREYVTTRDHLLHRGVKRCRPCADLVCADIGRAQSVRLPDGRTIAEVAASSGVKLNTVLVRWRRGWPTERLGEPSRRAS